MKEIMHKLKHIFLNSVILALGLAGIGTLGTLLASPKSNLKTSPLVSIDDDYNRVFQGLKMANPNAYGTPGTDYTDNLSYRVNTTDHTACVSIGTAVFDSSHTSLIIPAVYNDGTAGFTDCDVVAIDYSGFANQMYLFTTTFVDASKITLIDAQAFASCPNMTTFNSTTAGNCVIPTNLTKVYSASFMNCASFTKVFFAGGLVTEIGDNAFNGDIGIIKPISFNIASDSSLTIGNSSFANCISMRTILLPPGVKSIGEKAFYNCSSALMLTIPSSVAYDASTNPTPIGAEAFRLDANIKLAYIGASSRYPQGWPSDGVDSNSQDVIGDTHVTLSDWNYATNQYAIPIKTGVSNIMQYPDENNENLLYTYSFSWDATHKIYLINILTTSIPTDLTTLVVPQTLPVTGDGVHTSVLIANDAQIGVVTTLSTNAIDIPSTTLTSISLPNTMASVLAQSISQSLGTNVLSTLTLNDKGVSDSFTLYGDATNTAYDMDTYGLTGLTSIGNNFLSYTKTSTGTQDFGITSLTIPSTVQTIGTGAFKNCQKVTSLVFNGANDGTSSLSSIGEKAFTYLGAAATSTTFELVLPGGMTSIGKSAFYKADNIKSVTIKDRPSSSTATYTIGITAFNNCGKLHYAILGTGLAQINSDAFSNNSALNWVYMSSTLTTIASPIFQNDRRVVTYFASSSLASGVASGWNTNNNSSKDSKFDLNDRNTEKLTIVSSTFPYYLSVTSSIFGTDATSDNTLITNNTTGVQYLRRSSTNYILSNYLDYSGVTTVDLTSTGLPSFTSIGDMAFYVSTNIAKVTVNNAITSIGNYAFFFCKALTHLGTAADNNTFPTSLLTIGDYCFIGTIINTYGIILPSAITSIGELAFWCMQYLPWISIPLPATGAPHYYADGVTGAIYQITGSSTTAGVTSYSYKFLTFTGSYTGVSGNTTTVYQILPGTTEICSFAFASAKVASVNIPASVTTLDRCAFYVCYDNNKKVNSFLDLNFTAPTLKSLTFSENSNLTYIGSSCFSWQNKLTTLSFENVISTNTVAIISKAFRRCEGLTSLILPSGNISDGTTVNYLAESLFDTCSSLVTIKLPNTIVSYGAKCFWNNVKLTSTTECPLFLASLETINYGAFQGCSSLTSVSFPANSNLTTIGEWTSDRTYNIFSKCTSLTSVDFSNCPNLTSLPRGSFLNCTSLTSINLTNCTNLTSLGINCFESCTSLVTVDFTPCTSLHALPDYCFKGCTKLKTSVGSESRLGTGIFSIPSNITSIGQYCFQNCTSMTTLYMPTTITQVGTYIAQGTSTSTLTVYVAYDFTTFNSTMVSTTKWISTWWNLTASTFVKTYFYSSTTPTTAQKNLVPGTVSGGYWYWSATGSTGVITKYTW